MSRHDPNPEAGRDCGAIPAIDTDERGCVRGTDLTLRRHEGCLEIVEWGARHARGVRSDFSRADIRVGSGGLSRKQPLARAFGSSCRTIFDATAGLGKDAFLLACLGYEVTAAERSPVIAALLADGLRRATGDPHLRAILGDRLSVIHGDSRLLIPAVDPAPEAVYLDPMFPPKRKASALARKPVRILRALVGDDPDDRELFETASCHALRRVVVKRPSSAPPLGVDPARTIRGKLCRYDIYLVR